MERSRQKRGIDDEVPVASVILTREFSIEVRQLERTG